MTDTKDRLTDAEVRILTSYGRMVSPSAISMVQGVPLDVVEATIALVGGPEHAKAIVREHVDAYGHVGSPSRDGDRPKRPAPKKPPEPPVVESAEPAVGSGADTAAAALVHALVELPAAVPATVVEPATKSPQSAVVVPDGDLTQVLRDGLVSGDAAVRHAAATAVGLLAKLTAGLRAESDALLVTQRVEALRAELQLVVEEATEDLATLDRLDVYVKDWVEMDTGLLSGEVTAEHRIVFLDAMADRWKSSRRENEAFALASRSHHTCRERRREAQTDD